jgi:cytochrome c oxidase subunit 3
MSAHLAEHFADLEQQTHAARLGMWVFLASEVLLFAGLFTMYAGYRALHPQEVAEAIEHNNKLLGSLNTVVLIASSYTVALGLHAAQKGHRRRARALIAATIALAGIFLVNKAIEYGQHFAEGHGPRAHVVYTIYYYATGAHAVHVVIGMSVLTWLFWRTGRPDSSPLALELGALYWHLVDMIWIFLWPLFYLTGGHR